MTILTGFLGSGKTTLLQRLLECEGGQGVAVLINELGEVALDHLFVQKLTETSMVLANGCICCTMRSDLQQGIRDLINDEYRGVIPPFNRILVETTGLADPTPIAQTLVGDPLLLRQTRLANIITTVDALFGAEQIETHEESLRQAAIADRIVLTKTDIATPEQIAQARAKVAEVNPMATLIDAHGEEDLWKLLFDIDPFNPETKTEEVQAWLENIGDIHELGDDHHRHDHHHEHDHHEHDHHDHHDHEHDHDHHAGEVHHYHEDVHEEGNDIETFAIRTSTPLNWTAFAIWLSALVYKHGQEILRIKGLLNVPDANGPVVLNTVQSYITPPTHLDEWPDDDHDSRIVFIVQGLKPSLIRTSLDTFLALMDKK